MNTSTTFLKFLNSIITTLEISSLGKYLIKFAVNESLDEQTFKNLLDQFSNIKSTQRKKLVALFKYCSSNPDIVNTEYYNDLGVEKLYYLKRILDGQRDINLEKQFCKMSTKDIRVKYNVN